MREIKTIQSIQVESLFSGKDNKLSQNGGFAVKESAFYKQHLTLIK